MNDVASSAWRRRLHGGASLPTSDMPSDDPSGDTARPGGGLLSGAALHVGLLMAWALYVAAFPLLASRIGVVAAAIAFLVVALAGALGGLNSGLIHGAVSLVAITWGFTLVNGGVVDVGALLTGGSVSALVAMGIGAMVGRLRDLHVEVARHRARLAYEVSHDHLTGLLNRQAFTQVLTTALQRHRTQLARVQVAFIDLDGFKRINDQYGHAAGDAVLREVARRMRVHGNPNRVWGRLSGDEFIVLDTLAHGDARPPSLTVDIAALFERPVEYDGQIIEVRASVGLSAALPDDDSDAVLRRADACMYRAKRGNPDPDGPTTDGHAEAAASACSTP